MPLAAQYAVAVTYCRSRCRQPSPWRALSITPQPVKPGCAHAGIPLSVLHVDMPEVGREAQGIHALIHELEPTSVPQRVRMKIRDAGPRRRLDLQLEEAVARHRPGAAGYRIGPPKLNSTPAAVAVRFSSSRSNVGIRSQSRFIKTPTKRGRCAWVRSLAASLVIQCAISCSSTVELMPVGGMRMVSLVAFAFVHRAARDNSRIFGG